jgi:hypothetical protein
MGRKRTLGAGLIATIAVLAVAGLGATSASAAEIPELGRCVKVTGVVEGKKTVYNGKYSGKGCGKQNATSKGKFEWLPGPGAQNKFYGVANEPEPTFETTGGLKIECSVMIFKGEYTGGKTAKVTPLLGGCESGFKRPCQTVPTKEGEIEGLEPLAEELNKISSSGTSVIAGWDVKGLKLTFSCGKLPEISTPYVLEGSFIGRVYGGPFSNLNRMEIETLIKYKQTAGKQLPEMFEGGAKETLLLKNVVEKTEEQTGLATFEERVSGLGQPIEEPANQEMLEIKTKGN